MPTRPGDNCYDSGMPRLVDTQERLQVVAEATLALVRRGGPEAATVRGAAREANLSLSSIQVNWRTRTHLLDGAVLWVRQIHGERFRHALFTRKSRDAGFLVEALLPSDEQLALDRGWRALVSAEEALSARSRLLVQQDRLGRRVQCHETLLDQGATGEGVDEAAVWLLALLDGLFVARCDTVEPIDLALATRIVEETLSVILDRLVG